LLETRRAAKLKPTRRSFIKTVAVGVIGNGIMSGLPLDALAKTQNYDEGIEIEKGYKVFNSETQKSMEALADTLLPGAKEISMKDMFMNYVARNPGEAGFFDGGFWNLDTIAKQQFKKAFYKLSTEQKKAVIGHVSVSNRSFFLRFSRKVTELYYSHPAVWKRLSYAGPPQPRGFMDYHLPPKKTM
jgi:hypothetical protein